MTRSEQVPRCFPNESQRSAYWWLTGPPSHRWRVLFGLYSVFKKYLNELSTSKTQGNCIFNLHFWFLLKFRRCGRPGPTVVSWQWYSESRGQLCPSELDVAPFWVPQFSPSPPESLPLSTHPFKCLGWDPRQTREDTLFLNVWTVVPDFLFKMAVSMKFDLMISKIIYSHAWVLNSKTGKMSTI